MYSQRGTTHYPSFLVAFSCEIQWLVSGYIVLVLPMAVGVTDHSLNLETFFSLGGHYSEPPVLLSLWLLG